jgi:hypothetical protein
MMLPHDEIEAETKRILELSDKEVLAEHLALYEGDKRLAQRSIDMMRARLEKLLAERWKQ